MSSIDELIIGFDRALRTLCGPARTTRPSPAAGLPDQELGASGRLAAAALMRVNHSGEVCAQALYHGQALTARSPRIRTALERASREEQDHLAWCESRLAELNGRQSLLNPLWYAGSFALGALSGLLGDRWNLAFLVETERQVESHLKGHIERLPVEDVKSRAILAQMREDEAAHAAMAIREGAAEMPEALKRAMRLGSGVMTGTAYWI
jgi:3-demethoxyubiquinol 3-hydroxylase